MSRYMPIHLHSLVLINITHSSQQVEAIKIPIK